MDTVQMLIRCSKEFRDKIHAAAAADNRSMTKYVVQALQEKIKRDARK